MIYQATVELDDIANAFPAVHRIAVALSTTYWPIAWPSPELTTLTLVTGESHLSLPVRPPDPADAALRPYEPAEMAAPTPITDRPVAAAHRRAIRRDLLSGTMEVDFPRWTYCHEMPDIGQTVTSDALARYRITDGDPLSAECETEANVVIERSDGAFGHHSTGRLSCDATHFRVEMTLRITENGAEIFQRRWDQRIARDHV
ncbi:MAG: CocE/NonD family hydrolase C-terminal non-catalytic domain-containing protein [Paracoccaceae bacterium]